MDKIPNKICRICLKQKSEDMFSLAKGNKSGVSNRCIECDIVYQKEYRRLNRKLVYGRQTEKRRKRKQEAVDSLGGVCSICKIRYPIECYDFHHINPEEKESMVCIWLDAGKEKFWREVNKCILVCASCHRTIHKEDYAKKQI